MSSTSTIRSVAVLAAGVLLLSACSAADDTPPVAGPSVPDEPSGTPTDGGDEMPPELPDTSPIVASWAPGTAPVDLGGGRTIGDCEGDMPALCVMDGTTLLGFLEEARYAAPDELAGRSGEELDAALRDFAAVRTAEVAEDRAAGCGPDHEVLPDAPGTVTIDGEAGLRYGFATVTGGRVVEHVVTWATVIDDELRLVVAHAASPDGCMASDLTTFPVDDLVTLLPVLDRVMAGTPLPA